MKPTFFATPAAFRRWLARHHASAGELVVGFHKRDSGLPSMTWPESVEQALCFGWIDGVRRSLGETSYTIRFTPRKATSTWSRVNVAKANELITAGLMQPAGLAAFERRSTEKTGRYSFEQEGVELGADYERRFRGRRKAWRFFEEQPPWYRRAATWFVISAKKEETRLRRLEQLIAACEGGVWIGPLSRPGKAPPARKGVAGTKAGAKRPAGKTPVSRRKHPGSA